MYSLSLWNIERSSSQKLYEKWIVRVIHSNNNININALLHIIDIKTFTSFDFWRGKKVSVTLSLTSNAKAAKRSQLLNWSATLQRKGECTKKRATIQLVYFNIKIKMFDTHKKRVNLRTFSTQNKKLKTKD